VKRSQIVFVTVVFTALLTGILLERARRSDPFESLSLRPPMAVPLEPLEAPRGTYAITGRVVSPDGSDVAEALVDAYREEERDRAEPLSWTVTNPEGRFVLDQLFAGPHRVEIWQMGREVAEIAVTVPVKGEVSWELGARLPPLSVLPELVRAPLTGSVHDAAGHPLPGHDVVLWPADDNPLLSGALVRRATSRQDGSISFPDLVLAHYRVGLLPSWARGGSWPILAHAELVHQADGGAPLELAFDAAAVTGRLLDTGQRPIEGALVQLWPSLDAEHLWPAVETNAEGAFRLDGLPAGRYVVRIRAGAAALEREVELEGGQVVELELPPVQPRGLDAAGGG